MQMLLLALLCVLCAAYWLWVRRTERHDEPPYLSGAWPMLGHLPSIVGNGSELWRATIDSADEIHSLGGVVRFRVGPTTIYDPDDATTVANSCLEREYTFLKPWLGQGLFSGEASNWKKDRKMLSPAFNQSVLDTFIGVFNSQSRKLVKQLEKQAGNGPFDHWDYTMINSLERISLTMLGDQFPDLMLDIKYAKNVELVINSIVERVFQFWWHSPNIFRFSKLQKTQNTYAEHLHNVSNTILQRKKSEFNGNNYAENNLTRETRFKSFMDILLELSRKSMMSDTEVRSHVDTIIAAGTDTTAVMLVYIMTLLGSHPKVQDKVFSELQQVFGDDHRDIEKQDLSKLVYLEAVIKETMRIHSITPIIARTLDKDIKLKNCTLSSGYSCVLLLTALHRHPIWGEDRHEFRPERWLDPSRLPGKPEAYAPFGIGRRTCIGKVYSLISAKITIAHLIRHYRITADDSQLRLKFGITLKPLSGYFVSIEKRI